MTFEHGRIKTWRLPRFSAFEMDLRQSARTCGEKGEGSVPVTALRVCVCGGVREPRSSAVAAGLQPLTGPRGPAAERRNSRELPARSRERFSGRPCTSGAATAYIRGLGAPRPRFAALRELQRAMPNPYTPSPQLEISTQWRTLIRTMIAGEPCVGSGAP